MFSMFSGIKFLFERIVCDVYTFLRENKLSQLFNRTNGFRWSGSGMASP